MKKNRLRIAIQKSGRLSQSSITLLDKCGLEFESRKNCLLQSARNFPADLLLVRDDDIPSYIAEGICDLGIVGENVLREKVASKKPRGIEKLAKVLPLEFGGCRLSIALKKDHLYFGPKSLDGLTLATSFPFSLAVYLREQDISANIVELGGSVEIAPTLDIAHGICDLVSSGTTLESNGLREVAKIFDSQAWLVRGEEPASSEKTQWLSLLVERMRGVITATQSKYIMMNAPTSAVEEILKILPGLEQPSVIPLGLGSEKVAIHSVAREEVFWETIERLREAGASSILVMPIEKVLP
jgi:ATP phosphoribosyltransferase